MKRQLIGVFAGLVAATALIGAQGSQTPPQQPQKTADVAWTGCLVQGSTPSVFLLDRARMDPQSTTEKPATYVIVPSAEDLSLVHHLNHEVLVTGMAEQKSVPAPLPGKKVDEKDLPKLQAKSLTMVSDFCAPAPAR